MFRKCLENQEFEEQFELKLLQMCQEALAYENTERHYTQVKAQLSPEIEGQSFRFGYPQSPDYWNWACFLCQNFLMNRVEDYTSEFIDYVGVDEPKESVDFSVYPNPAKGVLFVRLPQCDSPTTDKNEYRITNLMGQTLLQGRINTEIQQINIENLPTGMFFITFAGETQKFVIR